MDTTIVLVHCLCDDLLRWQHHHEDPQCHLSDAEVMTIGLVAALFGVLGEHFKQTNHDPLYLLDSMSVAACDNTRIVCCRLYRQECYRGYQASKKRYVYGLKLHLMVTQHGEPVEFFLTPASYSDAACLASFDFDLPPGALLHADKAYNVYLVKDLLAEYGCRFSPMRKARAKHPDPPWVCYLQADHRKRIETADSLIERMLPKHIHAVTAQGFETKVARFVIAHSINCLID